MAETEKYTYKFQIMKLKKGTNPNILLEYGFEEYENEYSMYEKGIELKYNTKENYFYMYDEWLWDISLEADYIIKWFSFEEKIQPLLNSGFVKFEEEEKTEYYD